MAYQLGDVYIGNYPITQNFGARPETYNARFGITAHNGTDIGCPSLTPILSAADGWVSEIGSIELGTFDSAGYGNYIKVVHNGYLTLYGHLNDIQVKLKDHVVSGQLLGHSNNSGFSDGAHLHFGVAPCDEAGNKTESNNGYSGYIDPMGSRCEWHIQNLTAPVTQHMETAQQTITIPVSDNLTSVIQGTNYKVIAAFLLQHGLNEFVTNNGHQAIDLEHNPQDPKAGEVIVSYLSSLIEELRGLRNKPQPEVSPTPPVEGEAPVTEATADQVIADLPTGVKDSIIKNILRSLKEFIFVKK